MAVNLDFDTILVWILVGLVAGFLASHLALGNAYATSVDDADRERINSSAIHIDFMIGSDEVAVTGIEPGGGEVPLLRGGVWKI